MAVDKKDEKKKVKAPTALKRHKQDIKKNLSNRIRKSQIHTARTAFAEAKDETVKKNFIKYSIWPSRQSGKKWRI